MDRTETRTQPTIEELARDLPDVDWERPTRSQVGFGFFARARRAGLLP